MNTEYFVDKDSVVRQIWGKADTILFIFAGAAAEFALNKSVDWLYFTGRLPADPIGRLFSTVSYARMIVFSEKQSATRAIESMRAIHKDVELKRGASIPDWAYRDVLFMLIDYSIRSYELLERPLTFPEKEEVFRVFYRVGSGMGINGLPHTLEDWEKMQKDQRKQNLQRTAYTDDLFAQYRKHLGAVRFKILLQVQALLVPPEVGKLMGFGRSSRLKPLIALYKFSKRLHLDGLLKNIILPSRYKKQFKELDQHSV